MHLMKMLSSALRRNTPAYSLSLAEVSQLTVIPQVLTWKLFGWITLVGGGLVLDYLAPRGEKLVKEGIVLHGSNA